MKNLICLCLLLSGCVPNARAPAPTAIVPPIKVSWPKSEWQAAAEKAYDAYRTDAADHAEGICAISPKGFYVAMLSGIAEQESGYDPMQNYTENFTATEGGPLQISAGLVQLSVTDGANYKCDFKTLDDVHDAGKNIDCGMKILLKWTGADGMLAGGSTPNWRGGARYWSTLRALAKRTPILAKAKAGC